MLNPFFHPGVVPVVEVWLQRYVWSRLMVGFMLCCVDTMMLPLGVDLRFD
jgi:hypothetical protein